MQYLSFYYFNVANLFCFIRYGSTDNKKKKRKNPSTVHLGGNISQSLLYYMPYVTQKKHITSLINYKT